MAKLYGARARERYCDCSLGCCSTKRGIKAKEEREWRSEANKELEEQPDAYWLFLN